MGFPWGLDFGNQNCVVAIARKGGIDVIDNEASSRKTPCMVGLGSKERAVGVAGAAKINSNVKNTATDLKRLIGRRWAETDVQDDIKNAPYRITEAPDGGILINLPYEKDGQAVEVQGFTPEQLLAMLFVNLKATAESHNKSPSPDCVVSVPCWFTDAQRRATLDAANIAGIKVLRLLSETAATALCWGLPKSMEFPEDTAPPKHCLFFDMGHSTTQVCIVAFTKSKMTVLASGFDRNLGGREFDNAMLEHFAAEWQAKNKLNIKDSPKAVLRLLTAIDKLKQQLSGYTTLTKLPINVECLQDDRDFSSSMDTDTWAKITQPLIDRALDPVKRVINDSKVSFDQLDEIEVVGSATRSPLVLAALREFLGKEPKRTLNSEEAVSKGCALCAAMISPNFRVREFAVADSCPYPIALSWSKDGVVEPMDVDGAAGGKASVIFAQHNVVPSTKMLTFMRDKAFDIFATYSPDAILAPGTSSDIGKFSISGIPPGDGPSKIKVKVRLNMDGILSIESAQLVEEVEVEDEPKKEEPKAEAAAGADAAMPDAAPAEGAAPAPEEAPAGEDKSAAEPVAKKTKVKKHDLPVSGAGTFQLSPSTLEAFKTAEYEMSVQDKHIKDLQERRNDLETYIYKMRDECSTGQLSEYISAADKETFLPMLDQMEDWLYSDEADSANKSLFIAKLDELKAFGGPAEMKYRDEYERPAATAELQSVMDEYAAFHATEDKAFDHISAEDRAKVKAAVDDVSAWLGTKQMEQGARAKHEALACTNSDIYSKRDGLVATCRPIKLKQKPLPPKPDPKPVEKAPEAAPNGSNGDAPKAEEAMPDPAPAADQAPPAGDAMEAEALD
eukprot:CAMPEP_0180215816 /NCGR_PEP_ID=MMETSP0987-20121128/15773_1 /TAXON_ID=697907 /ORGANISM="non described non described, Strain CCMP2293" /LENGTH=843 /DNA_ID=CAMNT_0022174651 /DNA_START=55 /DNA_END=2586 /DNA_ORIENTATION=+